MTKEIQDKIGTSIVIVILVVYILVFEVCMNSTLLIFKHELINVNYNYNYKYKNNNAHLLATTIDSHM